jgi:hypothetical protein
MNKPKSIVILAICSLIIILSACKKKENSENNKQTNDVWDLDKNPSPKFVNTNYIELANIYRISKYRSSVGHDYSDFTEHCRSMKHYFEPLSTADWSIIKVFAPVTGQVTRAENEGMGIKIEIASDEYPAFRFQIFHINLSNPLNVNDHVTAGQQLGTHIGSQTYSDISVLVNDATKQGRMVSYFDVMTDALFNEYVKIGITSRDSLIIPKALRDAHPLTCDGDQFAGGDTLESWVYLK